MPLDRDALMESGHRPEATEGSCDRCGTYGDILLTIEGEWMCISCLRANARYDDPWTQP